MVEINDWNKPSEILDYIKKYRHLTKNVLEKISYNLKDNPEFMLEVIKLNFRNLQYASERLKDNPEFILSVIEEYLVSREFDKEDFISYASNKIKNNREIMFRALTRNPWFLRYASDEIKDDKEFILSLYNNENTRFCVSANFKYLSDRLKDDEDVVRIAISGYGGNIEFISERFKNDKSILLFAQEIPLKYLPDELKEDKEIILLSIDKGTDTENGSKFYNADEVLPFAMKDREILLNLIKGKPSILKEMPDNIKKEKEVILNAVSRHPKIGAHYIPEEFKYDRDVVLTALKHSKFEDINRYDSPDYPYSLERMPDYLKEDKEIFIALTNAYEGLFDVPDKFKDDKDIMAAYVKARPSNIEKLSDKLKNDKEFLLELTKDSEIFKIAKVYIESKVFEEIVHEYAIKNQMSEDYSTDLLNKIVISQEIFKQEQNDCVNYITLVKDFNENKDIYSDEKGKTLDKMTVSPCYQSYILGIGEYAKYEHEIVSEDVKKIFEVCKQIIKLYTSASNTVIDFYIKNGYIILKDLLRQYLNTKDNISLYDRIICETLVSNLLTQIQLLQDGILQKSDNELKDIINLFDNLLVNDINEIKGLENEHKHNH